MQYFLCASIGVAKPFEVALADSATVTSGPAEPQRWDGGARNPPADTWGPGLHDGSLAGRYPTPSAELQTPPPPRPQTKPRFATLPTWSSPAGRILLACIQAVVEFQSKY